MNEPKPNPDCSYCHGTGIVTDYVPYGSTNVPMDTECECVVYDDDIECPICEGAGEVEIILVEDKKVALAECLTCDGTGYVSPEKYEDMLSQNVYERQGKD